MTPLARLRDLPRAMLPGHGRPEKAHQLPRDGDDGLWGTLAAPDQVTIPMVESPLRLPGVGQNLLKGEMSLVGPVYRSRRSRCQRGKPRGCEWCVTPLS